jgi:hypothetical protein
MMAARVHDARKLGTVEVIGRFVRRLNAPSQDAQPKSHRGGILPDGTFH